VLYKLPENALLGMNPDIPHSRKKETDERILGRGKKREDWPQHLGSPKGCGQGRQQNCKLSELMRGGSGSKDWTAHGGGRSAHGGIFFSKVQKGRKLPGDAVSSTQRGPD